MNEIPFDPEKILKTEKWLSQLEIQTLLAKVSYVILAQPNLDDKSPIRGHFTVFFNLQEVLPDDVVDQVLEKFVKDNNLIQVCNFHHGLGNVAFAKTNLDQPMPYFLPSDNKHEIEDAGKIKLFIFDFDANATEGFEGILKGQSGWSYISE